MNVVQITDGLGNQLFQYAFALALQKATGREVRIDRSWFPEFGNKLRKATPRAWALGVYSLRLPIVSPAFTKEMIYGKPGIVASLRELLHKRRGLVKEGKIANPLACEDHKVIKGFFQKACYVQTVRREMMEDTTLDESTLNQANQDMLNQIRACGDASVMVHIRRGDYTSDECINVFGFCPPEYYASAEALIAEKIGRPLHLFIFSDDPAWVRENYKTQHKFTCVDINSAADGYLDINLMRHCHHAIIANSSFSWWGAYLIAEPDSVIVAPKRWRADNYQVTGLIPDSWYQC